MKASERLREMDAAMTAGPWVAERRNWPDAPAILRRAVGGSLDSGACAEPLAALRNALPELIAVVEAATDLADAAEWAACYPEGAVGMSELKDSSRLTEAALSALAAKLNLAH